MGWGQWRVFNDFSNPCGRIFALSRGIPMIEGLPSRPPRFQRPRRRARQKLTARESYRSVLAALLLLFVFAVTLSDSQVISLLTSPFQAQRIADDRNDDDELRTGSILFVPDRGNICRQKLIDNTTWRIWDNGFVPCNAAVSWNAGHGKRYTPESRIETISDGFFPRR